MKKILITGVSGFIGQAVMQSLSIKYKIIGFDKDILDIKDGRMIAIKGNITDGPLLKKTCDIHTPDVIVHCAGIAHQKINSAIDKKMYDEVNNIATNKYA